MNGGDGFILCVRYALQRYSEGIALADDSALMDASRKLPEALAVEDQGGAAGHGRRPQYRRGKGYRLRNLLHDRPRKALVLLPGHSGTQEYHGHVAPALVE